MQRHTTTRTTRARSLRALTTITALMAIGLGTGASLADHDRPKANGYDRDGRAIGHAYEACGRCDRRDHHSHDDGGVLWIGDARFGMSDRGGAIEILADELRRDGYRVRRYGNELRIRSRHRLGDIQFSNGKFRIVVTDRDRCDATIRFYQVQRAPVVVRPGYGHGPKHTGWNGRGRGRGGDGGGWSRPVVTRPAFRTDVRWGDDRCGSGTTISLRW
ncbi:MAG: hypothetical protein ACI89L_000134 [Phycisphaerales bacterium]|jgi:uncharacterized protein YoaH (UPF0181 family)